MRESDGAEKRRRKKRKRKRKHKSFLQLKQAELVHKEGEEGWRRWSDACGAALTHSCASPEQSWRCAERRGEERSAPPLKQRRETWQRLRSCPAGAGEEDSPLTAGGTSGMTEICTVQAIFKHFHHKEVRFQQLNFSLVCLCWEGQRSTSPLNKRSALKSLYMQVNMPAF